ncbi:MAG: RT0821/Lpp0805 family surface protein [Sphingomonadales bacterium]
MWNKVIITSLMVLSLIMTGCNHMGKNEGAGVFWGTILGVVVGEAVGGKGGGEVIGGIIGASIGGDIGRKLDDVDKIKFAQTRHMVLERYASGEEGTWHNPDSGNSGIFVAKKAYQEDSRYCREFTQTVQISGKSEQAYGKACRMPDGTWHILNK